MIEEFINRDISIPKPKSKIENNINKEEKEDVINEIPITTATTNNNIQQQQQQSKVLSDSDDSYDNIDSPVSNEKVIEQKLTETINKNPKKSKKEKKQHWSIREKKTPIINFNSEFVITSGVKNIIKKNKMVSLDYEKKERLRKKKEEELKKQKIKERNLELLKEREKIRKRILIIILEHELERQKLIEARQEIEKEKLKNSILYFI